MKVGFLESIPLKDEYLSGMGILPVLKDLEQKQGIETGRMPVPHYSWNAYITFSPPNFVDPKWVL